MGQKWHELIILIYGNLQWYLCYDITDPNMQLRIFNDISKPNNDIYLINNTENLEISKEHFQIEKKMIHIL